MLQLELQSILDMLPPSSTEAHRVHAVSMATTWEREKLKLNPKELLFTQVMLHPLNTEAHRVPPVFTATVTLL
jgi:hypothetical protein